MPAPDLSRQSGFGQSKFNKWKAKFGGLDASALKWLRELEAENRKLKQMYADLSLEHQVLKDIVEKKAVKLSERRELVRYASERHGLRERRTRVVF